MLQCLSEVYDFKLVAHELSQASGRARVLNLSYSHGSQALHPV